jgi:hypothetical protein
MGQPVPDDPSNLELARPKTSPTRTPASVMYLRERSSTIPLSDASARDRFRRQSLERCCRQRRGQVSDDRPLWERRRRGRQWRTFHQQCLRALLIRPPTSSIGHALRRRPGSYTNAGRGKFGTGTGICAIQSDDATATRLRQLARPRSLKHKMPMRKQKLTTFAKIITMSAFKKP